VNGIRVPIPDDLPIPTCDNCGAEWLDADAVREYDAAVAGALAALTADRCPRALLEPCARPGAARDWWTEQHASCTGSAHVDKFEVMCSCACHSADVIDGAYRVAGGDTDRGTEEEE
jgi:hypothetical protein